MKNLKLIILLLINTFIFTQKDSVFIRKIYDECLESGKAYNDLRSLCKDVGNRLSGSPQAQISVIWSYEKLSSYGFDKVYKQEIKVPVWKRGNKEKAWIKVDNKIIPLNILALGGSISTNGLIKGELVIFNKIEDISKADSKEIKGKIVLINQAFDQKDINTFKSYGSCYTIRSYGAIEAAKKGAIGVLVRSLTNLHDDVPHTGSMHYDNDVNKIPAASISTNDVEMLVNIKGKNEIYWEMNCQSFDDAVSYNVIAEITGKEKPEDIITLGAHLDSWDVGEGAHDDGAGIVHCMEALRVLKKLNYQPKHTIRVVFFMNEENGSMGGLNYAEICKKNNENHIFAIESDRGGFSPRGFSFDGDFVKYINKSSYFSLLKPYEVYELEAGYGGVDINPLKKYFPEIILFGLVPDSQRYFDYHHCENDVFEVINKRELELGCALMASFVYILDNIK